ncbi:hypothetical protein NNO_1828 [Hydrogenimonas sp.]|nr:hypothetical protein NNO_1828 [Hydrogenimonas sp.]
MRRGVVLFITLAILLMLSGIIMLFLKEGGEIKASVRENMAVIQTNLLLNDMSGFLKKQEFSQEDIFYGSEIPVSLDLGRINGTISMTSAQNRININRFLKSVMSEQQALISLLDWLDTLKLKNQPLLISILLDSYDKDRYERMDGSEIVLKRPWFQNGTIANERALRTILNHYAELSGDMNISIERWTSVFGFEGDTIDLNYAGKDQLRLLYPDLPQIALDTLASHTSIYKSVDDIPIDPESRMKLLAPRFGIRPTLKSGDIDVSIEFETTQECSGRMAFRMELQKRKRIDSIRISQIRCP